MLTFLPLNQITELEKLEGQEINKAKEILAFEVTALIHGKNEAIRVQNAAKAIFCSGQNTDNMPFTEFNSDLFSDNKISVIELLIAAKLVASKGDARRLIEQGGISVLLKAIRKNSKYQRNFRFLRFRWQLCYNKKGKKTFHKIILKK